jgi:sec-independent protein translocase protein TatA
MTYHLIHHLTPEPGRNTIRPQRIEPTIPGRDGGAETMGIPAPTELILILGIALLVFGPKKIPEIMGGIGQGIKTFKKTMESDEPLKPAESATPVQDVSPQLTRINESAAGKANPG